MSQASHALQERVVEMDRLIRSGQAHLVRKELHGLKGRRLPRPALLDLAGLARRVGMFDFALRLLHSVVRSEKPIFPPASVAEIAMYAAVLVKIGARREALALLGGLDAQSAPEVLLFQSNAYFGEWRYDQAVPLLKRYIAHPVINDYQRRVGEVNLAAALIVVGRFQEAEQILSGLLEADTRDLLLLRGNSLELLTQIAVLREEFAQAEMYIRRSQELLGTGEDQYSLYMKKWRSVAIYRQDGAQHPEELIAIRHEALRMKDWEVARDCDFQIAAGRRDMALFAHIVFGTPYEAFRRRTLASAGRIDLPGTLIWRPGPAVDPSAAPPARYFDLLEAQESQGRGSLKYGQALHKTLSSLTADFYRPRSIGEMFTDLYPGEVFNPISSPHRVFRLIQRLRGWFQDNQMPLFVSVVNGEYRLEASAPFGLKVPLDRDLIPRDDFFLERLRSRWPYRVFSARQAEVELGLTSDQVRRLFASTEKSGELLRVGSGRGTRYRFAG